MAIYVFKMKTFSRSAGHRGSRATHAAAYRAGERIRDLRVGVTYNHQHRRDVLHKEIVLPAQLAHAGTQLDWARSRQTLWNAAEHAETRRNARVAREFTLALPHELQAAERVQLAQRFAHELADRYQNALDLVIHAPRGDARNFHAHLLATTREVSPEGLGRKTALELSGTERHRRGLSRWSQERDWLRERWAQVTNHALESAHIQARVSHLPATPDLSRPPRVPLFAWHMERKGAHSFVAERIRAQHRESLQRAMSEGSPGLAPDRSALASSALGPAGLARSGGWLERVRERAQAAWLGVRERLRERTPPLLESPALAPAGRTEIPIRSPAAPARQPSAASETLARGEAFPVNEIAEQSARAWLAYRERMQSQGVQLPPGLERESRERQLGAERAAEQQLDRDQGLDLGL